MISQNREWINFKEVKTLPHALSLEPNDTSTSNLLLENYTGYLLSLGLYSKFCSSLSRLSMVFVQLTCHLSSNNTAPSETYAHPLNYFSFSIPILGNSLLGSVKNTTSLSFFKSSLKTFLSRKFYS